MPTNEERLARAEAKLETMDDLRALIIDLRTDMNRQFMQLEAHMDQRFAQVDKQFAQVDKQFAQVDKRFEQVDKRFEQVDKRFEQVDKRLEQVDKRLERLDQRIDFLGERRNRDFVWLVGIQMTFFIALISALAAVAFKAPVTTP
jgi:septal ring factor EnvC (AmiA/AmiB activator)